MKLRLIAFLCTAMTASADVWSGRDDWFADGTPGFIRVPRTTTTDGKVTVTYLNVDHIVRLTIKSEGKDANARAKLEIVTSELETTRVSENSAASKNVTYEIGFARREYAETAAKFIMDKKTGQRPDQAATKPQIEVRK